MFEERVIAGIKHKSLHSNWVKSNPDPPLLLQENPSFNTILDKKKNKKTIVVVA